MKDLSSIPAPTRADHQSKIANLFRFIHERSAKAIFGLTGAAIVLPMAAEAQVSPARVDIDQVGSISSYELQSDGSVSATLNNGQRVLITQNNVFIAADGTLMISELAAEELLLASDSAYGMIGVSTGEGVAAAVGGLLGIAGLGGDGSSLISKVLKIVDAPLENALVFYDSNTDGEANQTEYLGLSDSTGSINVSYDPVPGGTFIIIPTSAIPATAGTDFDWDQSFIDQFDGIETRDAATENVFTQILTATDAGGDVDQVVSPISTLVQKFVETGAAANSAAAEEAVKELLDIDASVDLDTFDFAEALESSDATEAANAKDVLHKATAIANVVETALAVAEAQGTDDGAGGTEALGGEDVVAAADEILTSVVNTMAAIKESVDSADAGTLATIPTFDDIIQAATAVAVADTLGGDEGDDDDVDSAALATALVDELEAGDNVDTAASDALTDAGVEEVSTVATLVNAVETASQDVKTQVDAATTLDDLDNDETFDAAEDALIQSVNEAINEDILGIDLQADAKSGVENQVNFIKGNLLQNDKYTNDLSLDTETELYSVNKKLVPEFLDTTADQGAFILSTADWNTSERTVTASRLNDELDSDSNPSDIMAAFPAARQTGGSATAGSMIYTTITVSEEDVAGGSATLSFDYNFGSYDYLPYNDYSFFAVHAEEGGTADEQAGRILRGVSDSAGGTADVRDLKGTGLYTDAGTFKSIDGNAGVTVGTNSSSYSYEFTEAGTYKVGIGITDVRDTIVDSVMSVNNIIYTPNGGTAEALSETDFDQIGNVQVDGGMVSSVNVALIQGKFGNLIVTKSGDYLYEVTPANSANIEDIPNGETVTEDFTYTVKTLVNGAEKFATSKLTVTITGTEFDPTVTITEDAIIGMDADDVNADTEAGYSVSGEIENVPDGATVTVTVTDGTTTVTETGIAITEGDDGNGTWSSPEMDLSALNDGNLTVTSQVVPDDAGNTDDTQTSTVLKDTDADVGDDFTISYAPADNGQVTVTVSGLDADATANIIFTAGDQTFEQGVEANGSFTLDVSSLPTNSTITAKVDIEDDIGNEVVGQQAETFFSPTFTATVSETVTSANDDNVTITLASSATGASITALSATDGTNTVNLGGLLGGVVIGSGGSVDVTGADLSSLNDGTITINATLSATIVGNVETASTSGTVSKDTDADADGTPASVTLTDGIDVGGEDTSVSVSIAGLDSDVSSAVITFTATGADPISGTFADGSVTVDLAGMPEGVAIKSSVVVTDSNGNTHTVTGPSVSLGSAPTIALNPVDVVNAAGADAVSITGTATNATAGEVTVSVTDGTTTVTSDPLSVASDGSFTATLDLSSLNDGTLTATGTVTVGEVTNDDSGSIDKDTVADDSPAVSVSLTDEITGIFDTSVTAEISGLDADATAVLTFTDGTNTVSTTFLADGGSKTVDLAALDSTQSITSSVAITDDAGNTASVDGPAVAFIDAPIYNATQDQTYLASQLVQAVAEANAGDTLEIAAGDITGDVTIDKALNIVGAHAGTPGANATDPSNMDIEGRGGETNLVGVITIQSADVSIDGVKLDNDRPLVFDLENAGEGGLDNFALKNSVMTTYDKSGVPTLTAPGEYAAEYSGPSLVTGWEISGNLIGGITAGNSGTMYLAGLEDSSISGNVFVRPTAGHLYLASLTNTEINDNFFYHGAHGAGVDLDGNGSYFNGLDGYGYGYGAVDPSASQEAQDAFIGRSFWLELKGDNEGVTIDGNDGQFNSGGIQLYGEFGNESFDDITISNNTFRDFINADPGGALAEGNSGLLGAIAISTVGDGTTASDIKITNNSVTIAKDQQFTESDLPAAIYVNGEVLDGDGDADTDAVTMTGNTVTITETSSAEILAAQTGTSDYSGSFFGAFFGAGITGALTATGNTISETLTAETVSGIAIQPENFEVFNDLGFTSDVTVTGNTFSGFTGDAQDDVVLYGVDLSLQLEDMSIDAPTKLVVSDEGQALVFDVEFGTSAGETFTDETGAHAIFTGGGADTVNLASGTFDFVGIDGMDSDLVTITNFSTAAATETTMEGDGIALYNLTNSDLRGEGYDLQILSGSPGDIVGDNVGMLVFSTDVDISGGAATAIADAVAGLEGMNAGDIVFAFGGTGTDAALVRVELSQNGESLDGAGTQIAAVTLADGSSIADFGENNLANFGLPEV